MRVLVGMSGGVDSSVAAAVLVEEGHDVTGATMRLWENDGASGCCSVAEIDDARRVAQQLGIDHHVFNFTADFDRHVVDPYVAAHVEGRTPNPCIECNRHVKFSRFLRRARQLGFDAVATGHHARVQAWDGRYRLLRGRDAAKDQSYVLYVLDQEALARCRFPVGEMTKADVRQKAAALGLRTATKPDSQDVCFVKNDGGRAAFLGARIPLRPGRLIDATSGAEAGSVDAVELVTVGQRRRMGSAGQRRYALSVDVAAGTVLVGPKEDTLTDHVDVAALTWVDQALAPGTAVLAQASAHGEPAPAVFEDDTVRFCSPQPRVAPGQSVVFYDGDAVLGGGIVA